MIVHTEAVVLTHTSTAVDRKETMQASVGTVVDDASRYDTPFYPCREMDPYIDAKQTYCEQLDSCQAT